MNIQLDHFIVPARDEAAAAKQLAEILGVQWGKAAVGPFTAVYVNEGLTLDFQTTEAAFPVSHYCFRVSDAQFDAILGRIQAAGIPYKAVPFGPMTNEISTQFGGRGVYWMQPEGHMWEVLTVSYARQP
jgi:hypothetical protein